MSPFEADMSFVEPKNLSITWILMVIELREGLVLEMVIEKGYFSFTHILDYNGILCKCVGCHFYELLVEEYEKIPFNSKGCAKQRQSKNEQKKESGISSGDAEASNEMGEVTDIAPIWNVQRS